MVGRVLSQLKPSELYIPSCEKAKIAELLRFYTIRNMSGGPGAVVKAACLESWRSRVRTPVLRSSFKETSPLTCKASILRGTSVT